MAKPILAWHFLKNDGSFCWSERKRKPKPGGIERVKPTRKRPLELCVFGLHASRDILDALVYAQGSLLRRVELSGEILEGTDKLCASERRELWRMDITNILHEFACWCAERALKREQEAGGGLLRGPLGGAAAWAAANAAVSITEKIAIWAADVIARDVAFVANWNAERKAQRRKLLRMIDKARATLEE